jgi:very-short-patch-repair endonuclease
MMDRLGNHARDNRRNPTEPEIRLWRHLSNRQLGGLKVRRQHSVDGRILDFFCPAIALGVEVDGHTHDPDTGRVRDAYIYQQQGITVIRVSNIDVRTNMEGVLSAILTAASRQPARWQDSRVLHPNPSSEEEGL